MIAAITIISDSVQEYISIGVFAAIILVIMVLFSKTIINGINRRNELLKELEQPQTQPQLFECKAVIVEKFCQRENKGSIKFPNTQECYYVVVKTPDGKLRKCSVTPEIYFTSLENQEVTVALENDVIYDINFD